MAKARKKTTRKKSTKKKQTQTSWVHTNLFRLCLLICMIVLSLIALFNLGIVGTFLSRLFSFVFGLFSKLLFIGSILYCGYKIFYKEDLEIRKRYVVGLICFCLAFCLGVAIFENQPNSGKVAFDTLMSNAGAIFTGDATTNSGLLGTLILAIFQSLFSYVGSYIMVALFIVIGVLMFRYENIVSKREQAKKIKPKKQQKPEKPVIYDDNDFIFMDDDEDESSFQIIDADPIVKEKKKPEPKPKKVEKVEPLIMESKPIEIFDEVEKQEEPVKKEPKVLMANLDSDYKNYKLPRLNVLDDIEKKSRSNANVATAKEKGEKLIDILREFGVNAQLVQIHIGPSVTKFEIKPELGVRVNKISNLQYDIKMALAAKDIRIEAPIPGKSAVGIEIPNVEKTTVQMKELMRTIPESMKDKKLLFCLGKDLMGNSVYGELNRMPHLLIAGATGSGKSVCVNSIISSILMRTKPDEVKLVLIDPKKVEFTPYNDVPHLLSPVITDGDLANKALKVVVEMMDRRYDLFGELGVRNITAYNEHVLSHPEDSLKVLPRIVIIIDELADLMLVAAKEVEASIQRITQLARAAGIHLIVATQRPSVDVITGVIKANIPSRIAFAVSQAVDSRTILDQAGAERLLGYGDMLYLPNGETSPKRIQGVFIKDDEVNNICEYVKSQAKPQYDDAFIQLKDLQNQGGEVSNQTADPLYDEVKRFVIGSRKASTSLIQRKFSVGYSRAARLMDVLEANGIIGPARGSKPREILVQSSLEDGTE
jgi:DNA segregation ATPase FtsK/SpoIIIE, S-DNA-T family